MLPEEPLLPFAFPRAASINESCLHVDWLNAPIRAELLRLPARKAADPLKLSQADRQNQKI
ncbi:Hypothetical predicted protein [Podarcis lilfordi]|uniref:Uncharacterized protein n=1 Tax=Podarcis lilfordi TaxID=74358 RepID=A0AA35PHF4_9SAUR|nr:Hypothetical predicted protein [Podarcis lilfordi]